MTAVRILSVVTAVLLLLPAAGCGARPKGFPKCYPCTVVLLKGGEVIPDSTATLIPTASGKNYVSSGTVDAQGQAVISTHCGNYIEKGVPEGEYRLVVSAPCTPPEDIDRETFRKMSIAEQIESSRADKQKVSDSIPVPEIFRTPDETPVTVTVKSSGENVTKVDMAEY